ncbi:MAG: DUF1611 domain-containing protein [Woeseia sp.]|nr:DUF1611 domain-containing protein [Woeseia sp.]NNL55245.1 DUF1611 domain-containing protein [Woeseia sp.]
MTAAGIVELRAPYLVMIGGVKSAMYAKTGCGIVDWRRELVAGQLRFEGCGVDLGVPDMSVQEAKIAGVRSLIIGVAPVGGVVPDSWLQVLEEAAKAGIDIVCGLHIRLGNYPQIVEAAATSGARLIDVRVPPANIPVGTGRKRRGKRVLTVGTDCAVGKKYSALALHSEMQAAGFKTTFRATGQTGIMIAGQGLPIDAVVADFVSGAAEMLSPDNDDDHWDVIEGQGSLFHPGYAAVSLGLLHGSQPDAVIVCHDASRTLMDEWEGYSLPSINECIELNVATGRLTNKAIRCAGVSVNTSGLAAAERPRYLSKLAAETGLPCTDPVAVGIKPILENFQQHFT